MAKPWPIALVLAGCAAAPTPPPIAPKPASTTTAGTIISDASMGPITGKTRATLAGLRVALPGFTVTPVYDGGLEYHVSHNGEHLYYVIPVTDGDAVFNVHIVSPTFSVAHHPWHATTPFSGSKDLSKCECWGDQPVCYKIGEHVAVAFKRNCEGLSDQEDVHALQVLDGVAVQRMIWNPSAFGVTTSTSDANSGEDDDPVGVPGGVIGGDSAD